MQQPSHPERQGSPTSPAQEGEESAPQRQCRSPISRFNVCDGILLQGIRQAEIMGDLVDFYSSGGQVLLKVSAMLSLELSTVED